MNVVVVVGYGPAGASAAIVTGLLLRVVLLSRPPTALAERSAA